MRIYSPINRLNKHNESLPIILYFHGGAFYRGSIGKRRLWIDQTFFLRMIFVETHHPITRQLAIQTGFVVISVEYVFFT